MQQLIALVALSLTAVVGAAQAPGHGPSTGSALALELQELVAQERLPGAIAIIEVDGVRIDAARVGWQDLQRAVKLSGDAIFRLYSMTKPITSVAIMMLAERGDLSLEDSVATYLPELAGMRVYVSGDLDSMVTEPLRRPITLRDLLLHDSGIVYPFTGTSTVHRYYRQYGVMRDTPVGRRPGDGEPAHSLDELVRRIGEAPLLHQPGSGFHYSYSTTVLGAVIERVTGERLSTALRRMLFDPLGMDDTAFVLSDEQLPRFTTLYEAVPEGLQPIELPETSDYRDDTRLLDGGGGLVSTADDYLRFARMLARGGELAGRRYLSESTVEEMFKAHIRVQGRGSRSTAIGYGFARGDDASEEAGRQPAGTVGWSGSGNTFFFLDPVTGLLGLFMTHELTPREHAARSAAFRQIMTRAAIRATRETRR